MVLNEEYILTIDGLKEFEISIPNFSFPKLYLKIVELCMVDFEK